MHKFKTVLGFELRDYFTNKTFMIFTIVLAVVAALALFSPRVFDMSDITGVQVVGSKDKASKEEVADEAEDSDKAFLVYYDETGLLDSETMAAMLGTTNFVQASGKDEVVAMVENNEAEAGYVVKSLNNCEYYVFNRSMYDSNSAVFEQVLKSLYAMNYCAEKGLDFTEVASSMNAPITMSENILNKDTRSNYWYCYILIILVFMMIIFYGTSIATSVTNEKSNRAIEVLVTTTTPNSLLFGKVIAGAIAGVFQVGVVLGTTLLAYSVNREVWGGLLDMLLEIPASVLITFGMFGLGGYLFYAFLYGAMGALVSKTEDVSKSSGPLMMVIMMVYFFSLFQLSNVDGPIIKVLSFLPISSYSSMFARIAMGTVAAWEIIVSFIILVVSIVLAGMLGAKIYRMGTLRYGNPIKLSTAIKDLKKSE